MRAAESLRMPYGRHGAPPGRDAIEHRQTTIGYYGMPAVKPSPYTWHIGVYLFIGGIGGAAQVIAAIAERFGGAAMRPVVRNARHAALAAALTGSALLIADLKTPRRWYNMLRIFRSTSPMSIGSYVLSSFGALSAATVAGEHGRRSGSSLRLLADIAQLPAAAAGAGMMTYTGALLSSTSTPLWAADTNTLSPRLAAGALASASAVLSLAEHFAGRHGNAARLDTVAFHSTIAQAMLTRMAKARFRRAGVERVFEERPWSSWQRIGEVLAIAVPLACHVSARVSRRHALPLSVVASIGILAGTAIKRWNYVNAGNASAGRASDYLRFSGGPASEARPTDVPQTKPARVPGNEEGITA